MKTRIPFRVQAMLATLVREPFDRPGWVYEEKYDGDRIASYPGASSTRKGAVFLAPRLIAQVAFEEWTADKKLRQPVFLGPRNDKRPGT